MVEKISNVQPPAGLKRWLFRLPLALYRAGLSWLLGSRFVRLDHIGRVTGKVRSVVLEVVDTDKQAGIFYVVAAWGEKADWFRNIKANPQVTYQVGRKRYRGLALQLPREEAEKVFLSYGKAYPRLLQELMHFIGYRIERNEAAYRELAGILPVVKLSPKQEVGE